MGHLLGYARVSPTDHQPQLQVDALMAAGCYRVFTETASGARADHPILEQVLDQLRPGDTLVVWKLDRATPGRDDGEAGSRLARGLICGGPTGPPILTAAPTPWSWPRAGCATCTTAGTAKWRRSQSRAERWFCEPVKSL
jgi:hypothetical protein